MLFVSYLPAALIVLGQALAKPTPSIHVEITLRDHDAEKPVSPYEHTIDDVVDKMIGFTYSSQNVSEACEDLLFDQSQASIEKIWERVDLQNYDIKKEIQSMHKIAWSDSEVFWLVHTQMIEHLSGEAYAINYVAPKLLALEAGKDTATRVHKLRTLLNVFDSKLIALSPDCEEGQSEDCNGQLKGERDSILAEIDKALTTLQGSDNTVFVEL